MNKTSSVEERKNRAIQIQENLEKLNANVNAVKNNPDKGFQVEWNDGHDRKIVFVPAEDFTGLSVYFYGDGLNTARAGLSAKAAYLLSDGIMKMLRDNKEFLDNLNG